MPFWSWAAVNVSVSFKACGKPGFSKYLGIFENVYLDHIVDGVFGELKGAKMHLHCYMRSFRWERLHKVKGLSGVR